MEMLETNEPVTRKIIASARSMSKEDVEQCFRECTNNRQFGSYFDPEREARVWVESFYEPDREVFVVVGTGRLHYHAALAKKLSKEQVLFVLDWQLPLIAVCLQEINEFFARPNVIFRFAHNRAEMMMQIIKIFDMFLTRKIKFGVIPPYRYLFPTETEKIQEDLRRFLAINLVRLRTIELFGVEWATNYHHNLPHMLNRGVPFSRFSQQFKDIPAVVVSAGPSLEKNVQLLSDIRDRAVIIAAGSSIETLMKEYGIIPHFLASFDAGAGNYPHFQNLDTRLLRLIFTGDIYPRILEEFEGVLIPVEAANKPTYEVYKQHGAPPLGEALIGPSVANFALDLAVRLGCNPIILVGQDLALRDGKSHAKGNFYRTEIEDLSGYIKVKGNVEEFVYTNKSWLTMLKNFEQQIRLYQNITIINATEGGAFIEGTVVKPLNEIIGECLVVQFDIEQKIDSLIDGASKTIVSVDEVLAKVIEEIGDIQKLIERTLPEIEKLLPRLVAGRLSREERKKINRIKKVEERLLSTAIYKYIIRTIIYGRILYYERYYSRLAAEQPDKVELWVTEYQKVLFTSASEAIRVYLSEIGETVPSM